MASHVWKQEAECSSCGGTGIYRGIGERGTLGVVCHTCDGTGMVVIEQKWNDFVSRKIRADITVVIQHNPGYVLNETLVTYGISYEEWLKGGSFEGKEDRERCCPAWWYQSVDYDKKPNWDWCGYGAFSQCKHFETKEKCWERFDKEQKLKKGEKS